MTLDAVVRDIQDYREAQTNESGYQSSRPAYENPEPGYGKVIGYIGPEGEDFDPANYGLQRQAPENPVYLVVSDNDVYLAVSERNEKIDEYGVYSRDYHLYRLDEADPENVREMEDVLKSTTGYLGGDISFVLMRDDAVMNPNIALLLDQLREEMPHQAENYEAPSIYEVVVAIDDPGEDPREVIDYKLDAQNLGLPLDVENPEEFFNPFGYDPKEKEDPNYKDIKMIRESLELKPAA